MRHISHEYKKMKLRAIKISIFALVIAMFFLPSYLPFISRGDNMFTVLLNGTVVGIIDNVETAKEDLREARRAIAGEKTELVLMDSELTTQGEEVLFGKIDSDEDIIANMQAVLEDSIHQTMHRSYVVKINEYTVNLASKDEVMELLQVAIDKYDTQGQFVAQLSLDGMRELPVLTASIVTKSQVEEQEEIQETASLTAGIDATFTSILNDVESTTEKSFEDYELGLISMNYGDDIEVVEAYLSEEELTPIDQAISEVTQEQETSQIYEVVSGDSLSLIAEKTNIPMEKIIEMNDTLENENSMIRVGDELLITVPEPELAIERSEELYYEEDYEADIIYVDNDEWYTTQTQTLQEPSAGHRKVVAVVSYRNDKETNVEIEKEEVTYEAVPKIVERGTKIPPTYIKPISGGRLSSNFGRRTAPTRGASSYHKGVDWSTPVGTSVVASSAGVVAKAGWGSGYGYVVYINHADGRQTRYGHLSRVLVSVGQTVSQGQKIALSGNTGVSTGPHVHFEILINGTQVNPLSYLN